jgi:hypothetical protein
LTLEEARAPSASIMAVSVKPGEIHAA